MNALVRCIAATLIAFTFACGVDVDSEGTASTSQALSAAKVRDQGAMFICEHPVAGPIDLPRLIVDMEMDRVYATARPGFMREWITGGVANGVFIGQLVARFDSASHAQAYSDFLDRDLVIDGTPFWGRPDFATGHQCHIWEVLGSEDRPTTTDTQVTMRMERFPMSGTDPRPMLAAWYAQLRLQAQQEGSTSLYLLYSEARREASLIYFQSVPSADRNPMGPPPVAFNLPLAEGGTFDFSGWNFAAWFPYGAGDSGRPAIWPLPGITASPGDGMCSLSRHESWRNTADCAVTCGNGAHDPGETPQTCPADVPLQ